MVLKNLNNFKYLTFIPARSGSVGVKNKNILKLGNKKLVEFTFKFIQDLNLKKISFKRDFVKGIQAHEITKFLNKKLLKNLKINERIQIKYFK